MSQFTENERNMLKEANVSVVLEKDYTADELKVIGYNVIDYIMSQSKNERNEILNRFSSITEKTVI